MRLYLLVDVGEGEPLNVVEVMVKAQEDDDFSVLIVDRPIIPLKTVRIRLVS